MSQLTPSYSRRVPDLTADCICACRSRLKSEYGTSTWNNKKTPRSKRKVHTRNNHVFQGCIAPHRRAVWSWQTSKTHFQWWCLPSFSHWLYAVVSAAVFDVFSESIGIASQQSLEEKLAQEPITYSEALKYSFDQRHDISCACAWCADRMNAWCTELWFLQTSSNTRCAWLYAKQHTRSADLRCVCSTG